MADGRMKTPMNRVFGLGSAHEGTGHWWSQRISSVALIPLTLLFIPPLAMTTGSGYDAVKALYAQPIHAIVAVLFIAASFWHLQQGLQVVIEDYVHEKWSRTICLLGSILGSWALGVVGVYAILKLSLGS